MLEGVELIAPFVLLIALAVASQVFGVDTREMPRPRDVRGNRTPLA
jgi:hypothetical protein